MTIKFPDINYVVGIRFGSDLSSDAGTGAAYSGTML